MKKITLIIISLFFYCNSFCQNPYRQFIVKKDFKGMLDKAQEAFKTNEKDSIAEFYMGFAYTNLKDYKNAIKHLIHVKRNGWNAFPIQLNLAKNYTLLDQFDKAIEVLEEVVASGNTNALGRLNDPEFSKIQNEPSFLQIKKKLQALNSPCKANPKYGRFNFWIGEWDVFPKNASQKTAESSITAIKGDCGIIENWEPIGGAGGSSISYFDPTDQKWKQDWVANGGVSHYIEVENSKEGDMQLLAKGNGSWLRMTWYNNADGTVRQHLESSTDEGKTWSTSFDGIYKRKLSDEQ